ncbi:hypothetical protein H8356DRAFT_1269575 [Neocallimastix lanati (nom. inval.)]|nr:hypothetical protein H8356DRAFT_1269575 [Neocallimastix sp. JGI-2020a]
MRFDNTYENYEKYMKIINQYNNILNVNYDNPGNEIEKSKNIFSEKKIFNNKNLSKIDQKSKINTNEQNLKFNYNVHAFEFKSDSLAEKNLGCTTNK